MKRKVSFKNGYWTMAVELSNGPKELYVIDGAGHFDLYDNPKYIGMALRKMNEFFTQSLPR